MLNYPSVFILLLLFSVVSNISLAATTSAISFKQGQAAFNKGEYEKSIAIFNELQSKKATDNIRYNLAIAYYKNKQYIEAKKLFIVLTNNNNPTYSSISYLNLGLIAIKHNKLNVAKIAFQQSIKTDTHGNTATLAKKMIARINAAEKEKKYHPTAKWLSFLFFDTTLENRSINRGTNNGANNQKNEFINLSFYTTRNVFSKFTKNTSISFNGFSSVNKTATNNDFSLVSSAINKKIRYKKWKFTADFAANYMRLDKKDFQASLIAGIKAQHIFANKHMASARFRTGYINGFGAPYSMYDGTQQKLRLQSRLNFFPIKLTAFYELETNDRMNRGNGTTSFYDYSPTRHKIKTSIETKLTKKIKTKLDVEYRVSQYANKYIINSSSFTRKDTNKKARITASYLYSSKLSLLAKYSYNDNNSSIETYSYNRQQVTLGLQYTF